MGDIFFQANEVYRGFLTMNISLMLKLLSSIDCVVRNPRRAPLVKHTRNLQLSPKSPKESDQECGFEHLPLTIEMWANQLLALKVLPDFNFSLSLLTRLDFSVWDMPPVLSRGGSLHSPASFQNIGPYLLITSIPISLLFPLNENFAATAKKV